jgi:hypothetical protein
MGYDGRHAGVLRVDSRQSMQLNEYVSQSIGVWWWGVIMLRWLIQGCKL